MFILGTYRFRLAHGLACALMIFCAAGLRAEEGKFVPPPRNIADITAILDKEKPDPEKVAKASAAAVEEPPGNLSRKELSNFYYKRALVRSSIGRTQAAIDDAELAIKDAEGEKYSDGD